MKVTFVIVLLVVVIGLISWRKIRHLKINIFLIALSGVLLIQFGVLIPSAFAVDVDPPIISGVTVSDITSNSAVITWSTNEPTNYEFQYGTTVQYGITLFGIYVEDTFFHTVSLSSLSPVSSLSPDTVTTLSPDTVYHFRVTAQDKSGNMTVSEDFTFTTLSSTSEPPPSTGGGGGERTLQLSPAISFLGKAYPGAHIRISARDMEHELEIPVKEIIVDSEDGSFVVKFTNMHGFNSYSFIVNDKEGRLAQAKIFNINLQENSVLEKDIFLSPTLGFVRSVITKGDSIIFMGYAVPNSAVSIKIDDSQTVSAEAGNDGFYKVIFNTADLSFGSYTATASQISPNGSLSDRSPQKIFIVSSLINPQTDFNEDGIIDIKDFSIFLTKWRSNDASVRNTIDLNGNGKVDISDFSIFIRTIKQK
ncbi:MAG: hypothetical protein Q7K54_03370 [Candidatus Parcubacteria bacterium]|nr:hypothetical protein [Candidatus Parcubacteria bacterium]